MQDSSQQTSEMETEEQLVIRAQESLSQCRWVVGECATKWTKKFARGRTDADFGNMIGLSGDQVYQRRRVWETFSDVADQFANLKWSHFYTALNWEDAMDCLQWGDETGSTVAEMKAWRRAQRGEDLSQEPEIDDLAGYSPLSLQTAEVQDPGGYGGRPRMGGEAPPFEGGEGLGTPAMTAHARDVEQGDNYAPFRTGAMSQPKEGGEKPRAATPQLTTEQLTKRLCNTIERCTKAINEQFTEEFGDLSEELQNRLMDAVGALSEKLEQFR